eukprot:959263-Pleurochrysis_carterae.AAC.1
MAALGDVTAAAVPVLPTPVQQQAAAADDEQQQQQPPPPPPQQQLNAAAFNAQLQQLQQQL